jgi:serine/threonine protein kinase
MPTTFEPGAIAFSHIDPGTAPLPPRSASQSPDTSPVSGEPSGIIARRYRVTERLGRGGQATVYKVFDLALRKPVAMKWIQRAKQESDPGPSAASGPADGSHPIRIAVDEEDRSLFLELDGPTFEVLADLLAGRRDDIQTVATTLGVTREDFNRALLRSLTSRGRSFTFGPVLERLGIAPDELFAYATHHQAHLVPLLREQAPQLFGGTVTVPPERFGPEIDPHTCSEVQLLLGPARQAGVLPLLDWGCEGDRPFLVFPLCVSDLSRHRRAEERNPREVAGWILQAAEALARLHAAGIVHADVKPHNLLLDETGRVFLADLGLTRVTGDLEPDHLMGSFGYMSPEQLCVQPLTGQSDIYSLGVTLYELLAGRLPHLITGFSRDEIETLRRRVLFEDPPPLPDSVPEGLKSICRQAMARDPADRFQTASQLSRALRRWLSPGWRGFFRRLTGWVSRPVRESVETVTPHLTETEAEAGEDRSDETPADRLRYRVLALTDAGESRQAMSLIDSAWDEHRRLADPAALAQFLWDVCRICDRGGERERALHFAHLAREAYRQMHSPMETFVSLLLAEWKSPQ